MTQYQELDIAELTSDEHEDLFLPGDIITFTGPGEHDVTTREITQKLTFVEILTKQGGSATEIRDNPKLVVAKVLRPIPEPPTVPGYYVSGYYVYDSLAKLSDGMAAYRLHTNGEWSLGGQKMSEQKMRELTPLVRLVPETEVSPEKLADRLDPHKVGVYMEDTRERGFALYTEDGDALIAAIDNGELDK